MRPKTNYLQISVLRSRDAISESVAALMQRPIRTLLTALGTILGVGAIVTTNGLSETARNQVSSRFDALRATEVRIFDALPDGTNVFPIDIDERIEELNGVNHAGLMFVIPDNSSIQARNTASRPIGPSTPIPVIAATPGAINASLPQIEIGRNYDQWHQQRGERVALLGRGAAEQLGITRIDHQPVIFLADTPYTVIGILNEVRRNPELLLAVVVPTSTAESQFNTLNAERNVIVDTAAGAAQMIGAQVPLALRPQAPERFRVLVPPDPKTLRLQVESDVQTLFYSLSLVALFIGTIAIANATTLNMVQRRAEIGLRRALGARRIHIAAQITLEGAITGVIAGITGAIIGVSAVTAIAITRNWAPIMNPSILIAAPIIGLTAGTIAGVLPALKASRTPAAETLRA